MTCQKRYINNEYRCDRCEMVWDINDEPPACLTDKEVGMMHLDRLKLLLELRAPKEEANESTE